MIDIKELNPQCNPMTDEIMSNLNLLFARLSLLQSKSGLNFKITSGLRSQAKQKNLIAAGKTKATKSNHLIGAAADVYDPDGEVGAWCLANALALQEIGLWCEHPDYTDNWVHFQIYPPKSGKRFFVP